MSENKIGQRWLSVLAVVLAIAQMALVLVSWLIAAAKPQWPIHSLLSSEGLRWFFGQFTNNLACPLLVWLVVLSLGWGAVNQSGLVDKVKEMVVHPHQCTYRERFALIMVSVEIVFVLAVMFLLTCVPHAVLLDVTGSLLTGAFPVSIIPVIAFTMVITGLTYGSLCEKLNTASEACNALASGIRDTAPCWLVVVLAVELYASVLFVFF